MHSIIESWCCCPTYNYSFLPPFTHRHAPPFFFLPPPFSALLYAPLSPWPSFEGDAGLKLYMVFSATAIILLQAGPVKRP